jgi:hypothetical protein
MSLNFSKLEIRLRQVQDALAKLKTETGEQLSKQGLELKEFAKEKLLEVVLDLTRRK